MRTRLRLLPLVLLVVLAAGGAGAAKGPDFRLPALDGKATGPADFRGRVVLLDFWATWCVPCHAQAEILDRVHAQYSPAQAQFLAIDVGEDEKTVREFLKKSPIPFPVLLDEKETVSDKLGLVGFPSLMILDGKGEVSFLNTGIVPEKRLRDLLQRAGAAAATPPAGKPAR